MKRVIFGIVGRAGSGKTTCITLSLLIIPNVIEQILSTTTRPMRSDGVDCFSYHFVSKEEFELKYANGEFINRVEVPPGSGVWYGFSYADVDTVLETKHGITATTEEGVLQLQGAGYTVIPVRIVAVGNEDAQRERYAAYPGREAADREREKIALSPPPFVIQNEFHRGEGREIATQKLVNFILEYDKKWKKEQKRRWF